MSGRQHAIPSVFGRRLQREREARHWTMRVTAEKCGPLAIHHNARREVRPSGHPP